MLSNLRTISAYSGWAIVGGEPAAPIRAARVRADGPQIRKHLQGGIRESAGQLLSAIHSLAAGAGDVGKDPLPCRGAPPDGGAEIPAGGRGRPSDRSRDLVLQHPTSLDQHRSPGPTG